MATGTAQILIGNASRNDGGVIPLDQLLLTENSRPCWKLYSSSTSRTSRSAEPEHGADPALTAMLKKLPRRNRDLLWIPHPYTMLDDALLMIGIHALRIPSLIAMASAFSEKIFEERLEVFEAFTEDQRLQLYSKAKETIISPKLIITVMHGSSLRCCLPSLQDYLFEVEVCTPTFSRIKSGWTGKTDVSGSLAWPS